MQHTQKYQLNLIDPSDTLSPEPLNQNAETVEAQLAAVDDKFTAADAAIQKNLGSGGKTARIAWGSYEGTGTYGQAKPNKLTFDFKPHLLIVTSVSAHHHIMVRGAINSITSSNAILVTWDENTVSWFSSQEIGVQCNTSGVTYYWVAIGESLN